VAQFRAPRQNGTIAMIVRTASRVARERIFGRNNCVCALLSDLI
jgi:hypothetical protein